MNRICYIYAVATTLKLFIFVVPFARINVSLSTFILASATLAFGPCNCLGAGNGSIRTFDGYYKAIFDQQKTLISQWGFVGDQDPNRRLNKCRFKLRIVTSWNTTDGNSTVYFDWAGFGFDVTKKNNKPTRNLVFGQCDTKILERGRGIQGIRVRSLAHNYVYYRPGFVVYVFKDFTQKLKLRTDTCEYAFNWFPRGRDTSFSLWLGNSYKDGSLLGMCGNCDDNSENDAVRCDGQPPANGTDPVEALQEISDSCIDGRHSAGQSHFPQFNNCSTPA